MVSSWLSRQRSQFVRVGRQVLEQLLGRAVGGEQQLDGGFGGGHLERGVERGEHAEEGQFAAARAVHSDRAKDLGIPEPAGGIALRLKDGVVRDLLDQRGELFIAGDRELPLEPVRMPVTEVVDALAAADAPC